MEIRSWHDSWWICASQVVRWSGCIIRLVTDRSIYSTESIQDGSVAEFTPHTAFDDPTTPKGAPHRESIELRTLVFYDWRTREAAELAMTNLLSGFQCVSRPCPIIKWLGSSSIAHISSNETDYRLMGRCLNRLPMANLASYPKSKSEMFRVNACANSRISCAFRKVRPVSHPPWNLASWGWGWSLKRSILGSLRLTWKWKLYWHVILPVSLGHTTIWYHEKSRRRVQGLTSCSNKSMVLELLKMCCATSRPKNEQLGSITKCQGRDFRPCNSSTSQAIYKRYLDTIQIAKNVPNQPAKVSSSFNTLTRFAKSFDRGMNCNLNGFGGLTQRKSMRWPEMDGMKYIHANLHLIGIYLL